RARPATVRTRTSRSTGSTRGRNGESRSCPISRRSERVMKHRTAPPPALAALVAGLVAAAGAALAPAPTPTPSAAHAHAASAGTTCGDCHTDLAAAFGANPHGRAFTGTGTLAPNDACATCHGDGTRHMEAGGDASLIQVPKGLAGSDNCLACHRNTPGVH